MCAHEQEKAAEDDEPKLVVPLLRRYEEEKTIQAVWQAVRDGMHAKQVVLVGGVGGTGKSTLVANSLPQASHTSSTSTRSSSFVSAKTKFDPSLHQSSSSSGGVCEALRALFADLVASCAESSNMPCREAVRKALSTKQGQVLTAFASDSYSDPKPNRNVMDATSRRHLSMEEDEEEEEDKDVPDVEESSMSSDDSSRSIKLSKDNWLILSTTLRTFLRAVSSVIPVILVLDDVHWASDEALELLSAVLADSKLDKLLVVATFRVKDDTVNPNFETWMSKLQEKELADNNKSGTDSDNTTEEDNIAPEETALTTISETETTNPLCQTISLENLKESQIQEILAEATKQSPDRVAPLAATVLQFTGGNPFFIKQYLETLRENEMLMYQWNTLQWTWEDVEIIKKRSSFTDEGVVQTLARRIHKLPLDVQTTLSIAAFFGTYFDIRALRIAATLMNDQGSYKEESVDECLALACRGEFLVQINAHAYKFSHDIIRLASYGILPEDPEILHRWFWNIGTALLEQAETASLLQEEDAIFFAAIDLVNDGSESCLAETGKEAATTMRVKLAKWNLKAAQRASKLSSFVPATSYLETGLLALGCFGDGSGPGCNSSATEDEDIDYGWTSLDGACKLAIKLYDLYSQTLFCAGRIEESMKAAQLVVDNAVTTKDKLRALSVLVQGQYASHDEDRLVTFCIDVLAKLGERIPRSPSHLHCQMEYTKMKRKLKKISDADVMSLPLMTNGDKEAAVSIMAYMVLPISDTVPLCLFIVCRMIQIILKHGISHNSPEGFALAAMFLAGNSHDIKTAYRLGRLAEDLTEKRLGGANGNAVQAYHMLAIGSKWWLEPIPQCLDLYIKANEVSMNCGEVGRAFQNSVGYLINYFYSGLALEPLLEDIEKFSTQYVEYNQIPYFCIVAPLWQCGKYCIRWAVPFPHAPPHATAQSQSILRQVLNMTGRSKNPLCIEGGDVLARMRALNGGKEAGKQSIQSYNMQLAFYVGDLPKATEVRRMT